MVDHLQADTLAGYARYLADEIGPRPAGHPSEAAARDYICREMAGIADIEELPFSTPDTWAYGVIFPTLLGILGNVFRKRHTTGGLMTLAGAYALWRAMGSHKQPLTFLAPQHPSADLIVRVAPSGDVQRKLVLLAHTDSNKHRLTFKPDAKRWLLHGSSAGLILALLNGLAQLMHIFPGARWLQRATLLGMIAGVGIEIADEQGGYVDGASDNASAVACLLGLAHHLKENPLEHTEVWFVFTGAEEAGCLGAHALLDAHGAELKNAWFLDFEMVATPQIVYITQHSGLSHFNAYWPDPDSLELAQKVAHNHPELGVTGRPMIITEEVGSLRGRGYRGLCIAGVGEDGWLANWHQYSDNMTNLDPNGLERAARFGWAWMQALDHQSG
jgi:hypothetical protein